MIYTYPDFRVLGFLGLKDMHMRLELFQVFLGFQCPNTQSDNKKVGQVQFIIYV
jgi:hypothetical protein